MMRPSMRIAPRALALTFASGLLLLARAAAADVGSADKLFAEGKALMSAGRFAEACAKYEASYEADAALGSLLNLADCLERDGRLASAYGRWGDAITFATRKNDNRASYAKDRREELKPKLSFVTLQIVGTLPDELVIYKGEAKFTSAGVSGTALPTDPGTTVIQVVRGTDVLWETKIELQEAQQQTVTVPLDEIVKQNPGPMKQRDGSAVGPRRTPGAGDAEVPQGFWSTQRIAGFIVGGVGVAGAAIGFALGGVALSKSGDLSEQCTEGGDPRYCTAEGELLRADAYTFAQASTWTLIGSGIVAAVGITVIVTAPNDYAKLEERAFFQPWFGAEGGGISSGVRF